MARYGGFKYGTAEKYGTAPTFSTLLWGIEIDWNEDGNFTNEADRAVGFYCNRGREFYLNPNGDGFEPIEGGLIYVQLANFDGRYDAFNASSPLYPDVAPGKDVKITVRHKTAGAKQSVFYGVVDDIQPVGYQEDAKVVIKAFDAWKFLRDRKTSVTVQQSIQTGDAIDDVLDDVGWPTRWGRSIGVSADTIPFWWVDGRNATLELHELNESEFGVLYIAANGEMTFRGRWTQDASVKSLTQSDLLTDISVPQPWETMRDIIRIDVSPYLQRTAVEIWKLQETPAPFLAVGESLTVWAKFIYDNRTVAAINVITPVVTTDFTLNAEEDGSGVDLSSGGTVAITVFSETAKIVLTNDSALGAYVTLLKLRGDAIDLPDKALVEDEVSGGGERTFTLENKNQQQVQLARNYARYLRDFLSVIQPFPVIQMEGRYDDQFDADLLARITLSIAALTISDDFRVGKIEHLWLTDNGQAVRTFWRTEPFVDLADFWFFTTNIGVSSNFAY